MNRLVPSLLVLLALVLVALPGPPARAGKGVLHTLAFPREGLTLDAPSDWEVRQYGEPVLELAKDGAVVRILATDEAAGSYAARNWVESEGGGARCSELFARGESIVFRATGELTAEADEAGLRGEVDAILDSVDVTLYEDPSRHVDWNDGWTLEVPEAWTREATKGGHALFRAPEGVCRLQVENLKRLLESTGGAEATGMSSEAWLQFAKKQALSKIQEETGLAVLDAPVVEEGKTPDGEAAVRVHVGLDPDAEGTARAWLHLLIAKGTRILLFCKDAGSADAQAREILSTFVGQPRPGSKAEAVEEGALVGFPGEGGPPVAFRLPEGWTQKTGSNRMRLAEISPADAEGTSAIVYYFGAGGGGDIEGNLERWRGQMGDEEGTTETFEVADGVKATLLDVVGSYDAQQMGGPRNPHMPEPAAHDDFRMLAVVLEVPDGPLFIKMVGPEDAVGEIEEAFRGWIKSFRVAR